jgi:hypothetical protein
MYAEWAPGDENFYAGFKDSRAIVTLGFTPWFPPIHRDKGNATS